MDKPKVKKYDSLNLKPETKIRIDSLYYKAKASGKKYRSFDVFINELLDRLEEN